MMDGGEEVLPMATKKKKKKKNTNPLGCYLDLDTVCEIPNICTKPYVAVAIFTIPVHHAAQTMHT